MKEQVDLLHLCTTVVCLVGLPFQKIKLSANRTDTWSAGKKLGIYAKLIEQKHAVLRLVHTPIHQTNQ